MGALFTCLFLIHSMNEIIFAFVMLKCNKRVVSISMKCVFDMIQQVTMAFCIESEI